MDITRLTKLQDSILADAGTQLKSGGAPAAMLARPLAAHTAQAARIKGRIAALEAEKADQAARIDTEIVALKLELEGVNTRLANDRKTIEPVIKATNGTRPRPT